jgi:hypothetical protein
MRAVNVTHHSSVFLQDFKTLFGDLQIPVEGNWGDCERMATFNYTEFGQHNGKPTLFVDGPRPQQ